MGFLNTDLDFLEGVLDDGVAEGGADGADGDAYGDGKKDAE